MPVNRPILDSGRAPVGILVGEDGEYAGPRVFPLAVNGVLSNSGKIRGGRWLWSCESTNWNSATATLQRLGQDGVTWRNAGNAAVTMTADGTVELLAGTGSQFRVLLSGGTPAAFYSNFASAS